MTNFANTEQAAAWDGEEGDDWTLDWQYYDRAVRAHQEPFHAAAAIADGERVVDVGCGTGESSRLAALAAGSGHVLGVDLSRRQLAKARELAAAEGIANVTFEHGDAQVHPFEPASAEVVISRFGAMFFGDQHAAFANLARALVPGGRLALVVWRGIEPNEWLQSFFAALAVGRDLGGPPPGAPGPFGLADADASGAVLEGAGFTDVAFDPFDGPIWFGKDAQDALAFFQRGGVYRGFTQGLSPEDHQRADAALAETMRVHEAADGVVFRSGVWIVTAARRR